MLSTCRGKIIIHCHSSTHTGQFRWSNTNSGDNYNLFSGGTKGGVLGGLPPPPPPPQLGFFFDCQWKFPRRTWTLTPPPPPFEEFLPRTPPPPRRIYRSTPAITLYYLTKRKNRPTYSCIITRHLVFLVSNTSPVLSNIPSPSVYQYDPDSHINWAVTSFYIYKVVYLFIEITCNLLGIQCKPCKAQELCPQRGLGTMMYNIDKIKS